MRKLVLLVPVLVGASAHAAEWAIPAVSTAVAQADAIVVGQVTARTAEGKRETWNIRVEETLKGKVGAEVSVAGVDRGDPQGTTSPYPPIPDSPDTRVVVFLKQGKDTTTAASRYLIDKDAVVFLGDAEGQKWTLPEFRTAVAQLTLLQAAAKTPELAQAAARLALQSKVDEVVWWGGSTLLRGQIPASLRAEIEAALQAAPEKGKARKVLEQCLKKAGVNSP